MSEYVLELKGITKIFPGVKALNQVQFQLKPGEVHALMGENGAGKSTFIKVITGVHRAEEGEMFLDGRRVDFKGPRDAQAAGIAAVYQHPTSYPDLTVTENIFMNHEMKKHGIIQWKEMHQEARKYLDQLDADFKPTAEMGSLSVAQQQMVEIAKAISTHARIIILDEPTAALTASESEKLYRIVDKLGEEVLRIEKLSRTGYFKDVSLHVRAGEIVGLAGLVGAGRTEVMEAVCGITRCSQGRIYLEGREIHIKNPTDSRDAGIILLPEDRQKTGLILSWGLGRNVTLPILNRFSHHGILNEKEERALAKELLEDVDTKAVTVFDPASSLSGGNQQKVVVAKALAQDNMKVVIMDEPTKGVDVGAKAEIYQIMGELAQKGYAIIMISSEMPEIIGMCDRVYVMCGGRVTGELNREELSQEVILEYAMEKGTDDKKNAKKEGAE